MKNIHIIFGALFLIIVSCAKPKSNETPKEESYFLPSPTTYNYANVEGLKLFYREAGDPNKSTIVLLHGYPSSSHSYRNLIPMLATVSYTHLTLPTTPYV